MQAFAEWLRQMRLRDGRSQTLLAHDCRERDRSSVIYQSRLTDWELGKGLPSVRQLTVLALELELSASDYERGRALRDAAELGDLPLPGHAPSPETPTNEEATTSV